MKNYRGSVGCDYFVPGTVFWVHLYLLFLQASIVLD